MLLITERAWVFVAMGAGLCTLGAWPVLWNYLERRGGNPRHIYMDYAATYLCAATIAALTLGQFGNSNPLATPNFLKQLPQRNAGVVLFATAGGACMGVGDAAMQYSVALLGLAVGPAVINSLIVVVGVALNYVLDNRPDAPGALFAGAGLAVAALILCTLAHYAAESGQRLAQEAVPTPFSTPTGDTGHLGGDTVVATGQVELVSSRDLRRRHPVEDSGALASSVQHNTQRSITKQTSSTLYGLIIAAVGGLIYSLYTASYNLALNDQFKLLRHDVSPLSVYCANFYFAIGLFGTALIFNCMFMRYPPFNLKRSTFSEYFQDNEYRLVSIAAGLLAWFGDGTQFMGGQLVGFASAMMVQAYPMVSTLLGIVIFKEFWGCSTKAKVLLCASIISYLGSIALLVYAGAKVEAVGM